MADPVHRNEVEELIDRLVENAFDFLRRSIGELEDSPNFSVIHFHAAVELFLKARLMAEHWSLVVSKRQEPDWKKLVAGDFQSVSLDEAASRLEAAVRSGLTENELRAFREVTKHRNKMVHFFHEAHGKKQATQLIQAVAKEQLNAWYLLHGILTGRWRSVFERWSKSIEEIHKALRTHQAFLQVVFNHLRDDIKKRRDFGSTFATCPTCGFESKEYLPVDIREISHSNCLVCEFSETHVTIECTQCQEAVNFTNQGYATCSKCGKHFEPEDLAEILADVADAFIAARDGDSSWDLGNCSSCGGYHTVARVGDEQYFCTMCFKEFDSIAHCGWCNEPNTGDMENSYYSGCNHCDGKAAWDGGHDD